MQKIKLENCETKKKTKKITIIAFALLFIMIIILILFITGKGINDSTGLNYQDIVEIDNN